MQKIGHIFRVREGVHRALKVETPFQVGGLLGHPHSTYAKRGEGFSEMRAFVYRGKGVPTNAYVHNTTAVMQLITPKIQ